MADPADVTIDWQVLAIIDPDGRHTNFAYTVGVHERHRIPDLHLWARPSDGDDPGADWQWSARDQQRILNDVAARLLAGTAHVGATWTSVHDGGFTTITWWIDPPRPAHELDCFQLPERTPVCAVRWTLARAPRPATPTPVPDGVVAAELARLERAVADRVRLFDAVAPGAPPAADDRFGPWTACIEHIRSSIHADLELWVSTLAPAIVVAPYVAAAGGAVDGAARAHGRSAFVTAAHVAADSDAEMLAAVEAEDDPEYRSALTRFLRDLLSVFYGAWVVADVLDDPERSWATGWLDALCDPVTASTRFAAAVADPGGGTPDIANDEFLAASVRAATGGNGAPLDVRIVGGEASAARRLAAYGM